MSLDYSKNRSRSRSRSLTPYKKERKKYTLEYKKKIVKEYLENKDISIRDLEEKYDIPKSCINEWINSFDLINNEENQRIRCRFEGGGRHSETEDIENELLNWIQKMRKLGISINTANIIIKAIELFPAFKGKNYKTLLNWSYRFLKRNNYSIRRATHLGQELKKNVKEEFIKFLNIIYSIRRTYHINESYECIINMDETPVWFEMISKTTVDKIGNKSVTVKTFGSERTRLSLLLAISANGGKLKSLIVFKGKYNSTKQNKLNKNLHVLIKNYMSFVKRILG